MKAPLSRSVPLACDLLALSKSCDAVNDNAGKKKKSKGYKQDGFDRPLSWATGLYGGLSCDIVWPCVSLCKSKRSVLSVLEVVFQCLWAGSPVGEVCKVCHQNRLCQNHVQRVAENRRRQGKDKRCQKVFKHFKCILAPLRPPQKCNFSDWNFSFNIAFQFFFIMWKILIICSKILSLLRKCGFMLASTGVEHKHIMPFSLNLSHFSAPRASCKPRQSKFKAIAMKETSISILCSVAAIWVNMLKVLRHSELIMLETGHLEILSAFITNNQGMGTKV